MNKEFVPPGHFYSAIPLIDLEVCKRESEKLKFDGLEFNDENHLKILSELPRALKDFDSLFGSSEVKSRSEEGKYTLMNGAFEWMDARMLYYMIMTKKPKRIIEIGSGFSTLLMCNTIKHFGLDTKITCIEPYPMSFLEKLNTSSLITLIKDKLENIDTRLFQTLDENDILFIDSSHVGKYNSDVIYYFTKVLPILKKGVNIHIHDIFFPFDYPFDWLKEGRFWNEQYYLFMFLQFNNNFRIEFCNSYAGNKFKPQLGELQSSMYERVTRITSDVFAGGSIWMLVNDKQ